MAPGPSRRQESASALQNLSSWWCSSRAAAGTGRPGARGTGAPPALSSSERGPMTRRSAQHLVCAAACSLLLQTASLAGSYYVDASGGSDGNSGRSPSAAWRTIAKVNACTSSAPGDRILLKRGEAWREQLIVPCSGATDNYSGTNAIRNNLFWQNGRGTAIKDDTVGGQATSRTTIAYNAFQQGAPSDTTGSNARILSESPFVDAAGLDFRLRPGSPSIDAGTDVGLTRNFEGKPVPQGRAPDIGAYEHAAPAAR